MLYDGKAETRSADLARVALVDAVKTLKNALLLLERDPDAVILDGEQSLCALVPYVHMYKSAGTIIFYRVFAEVVDYRVKKLRNAVYDGAFSGNAELHLGVFGGLGKVICLAPRNREEVDILTLHILRSLVEMRKLYYVVD